jgi:hypothetical protein
MYSSYPIHARVTPPGVLYSFFLPKSVDRNRSNGTDPKYSILKKYKITKFDSKLTLQTELMNSKESLHGRLYGDCNITARLNYLNTGHQEMIANQEDS